MHRQDGWTDGLDSSDGQCTCDLLTYLLMQLATFEALFLACLLAF